MVNSSTYSNFSQLVYYNIWSTEKLEHFRGGSRGQSPLVRKAHRTFQGSRMIIEYRTWAYFQRIFDFGVFSFLIILTNFGDFSFGDFSFDGFSLRRNLIAPDNIRLTVLPSQQQA